MGLRYFSLHYMCLDLFLVYISAKFILSGRWSKFGATFLLTKPFFLKMLCSQIYYQNNQTALWCFVCGGGGGGDGWVKNLYLKDRSSTMSCLSGHGRL